MEGNKFIARVNFQTQKHHKQILRSQINSDTIDKIQIAQNPSQNYQKAYRALYYDELDKQMQQQDIRKSVGQNYDNQHDKTRKHQSVYERNASIANKNTSSQFQKDGQGKNIFVDYFAQRNNKFNQLIQKNYDAGQSFYKNYQKYQGDKMNRNHSYAQILKSQIMMKEAKRLEEQVNRQMEIQTLKHYRDIQKQFDCQNAKKAQLKKSVVKDQILGQAEQQRKNKNRKSLFEYNKIGRHNPITNPIEYHIDNPYILKKIQNKGVDNLLKIR